MVKGGGSGGTATNVIVASGALYDAIILDPGDYELTVIAYVEDSSHVMQAAATNADAVDVTIAAGKIANQEIKLKVYAPNSVDTGIFSYKLLGLTYPTDFASTDTATMTLTALGTGTSQGPTSILSSFDGAAHTIPSLAVGYYYVDFILHMGADTVTFRHVVHIYKNLISAYTFTVTLDYFNAVFQLENGDITFDLPDINPVIEYRIGLTGSFTVYDTSDPLTPPTPITVTRGQTIEFQVNNTSKFATNSIEWYCVGNLALSTVTSNTITCTISTTGLPLGGPDPDNLYSVARDYYLTVVGTEKDDNLKYATVVPFSVTPPSSNPIITTLTDDIWDATGSLAVGGIQWFKFTSTDTTQYIHVSSLTVTGGIKVQLYGPNGTNKVGSSETFTTDGTSSSITLVDNTVYFIKVTPVTSSNTGTYSIGFNASGTTIP